MMLADSIISLDLPPHKLFVVTAKRVRAGKGIQIIYPTAWFVPHGGRKCGVYVKAVPYSIDKCFIDVESAFFALSNLVKKERLLAISQVEKLSAKLEASLKAANNAVLAKERKKMGSENRLVNGLAVSLLRIQMSAEPAEAV